MLQQWEETAAWLLNHTARWPKAVRFTLTQRLDNHALDVVEMLVSARYEPAARRRLLPEINLRGSGTGPARTAGMVIRVWQRSRGTVLVSR